MRLSYIYKTAHMHTHGHLFLILGCSTHFEDSPKNMQLSGEKVYKNSAAKSNYIFFYYLPKLFCIILILYVCVVYLFSLMNFLKLFINSYLKKSISVASCVKAI